MLILPILVMYSELDSWPSIGRWLNCALSQCTPSMSDRIGGLLLSFALFLFWIQTVSRAIDSRLLGLMNSLHGGKDVPSWNFHGILFKEFLVRSGARFLHNVCPVIKLYYHKAVCHQLMAVSIVSLLVGFPRELFDRQIFQKRELRKWNPKN